VVIATSATRLQVAPMARELGVEHVLCTRLATEGGLLTGKVDGRTLWGPGKIAAVREFAASRGVDLAASHAYANGDEDVPLLDGVGHPHPVNPQPELAEEAARRGWPVLRFAPAKSGQFDPVPALRTAALFGTLFAAAGVGIAVGALNGDRRQGVDLATSMFGALAGPLTDIDVQVVGEQHAWSHRPAVFLINHQSTLIDFLVATRVIRTGFTAVAKREVKQMPWLGRCSTWPGWPSWTGPTGPGLWTRSSRWSRRCARHLGGDGSGGHPLAHPEARGVQEGRVPSGQSGRGAAGADRHPQCRGADVAQRAHRPGGHRAGGGAPADQHGRLDPGRHRRPGWVGARALCGHAGELANAVLDVS